MVPKPDPWKKPQAQQGSVCGPRIWDPEGNVGLVWIPTGLIISTFFRWKDDPREKQQAWNWMDGRIHLLQRGFGNLSHSEQLCPLDRGQPVLQALLALMKFSLAETFREHGQHNQPWLQGTFPPPVSTIPLPRGNTVAEGNEKGTQSALRLRASGGAFLMGEIKSLPENQGRL